MTDDLRETIRAKLAAGVLRREAPARVWHGYGAMHACVACGHRIFHVERECEVDFADAATFRFHRDCFYIWDEERRTAHDERRQPDEACAITALLLERSVCLPCIVEKTTVPVSRARAFLTRVPATVQLSSSSGQCAECDRVTQTYRIG